MLEKIEFKSLFLSISLLLSVSPLQATPPPHVIRAAIDIGMGGPKLQVAEVDPTAGKIVRMLHTQRYFVNFHEDLSQNGNHQLSPAIMEAGRKAFCEAVNQAQSCGADGIVAIATAAFRLSANGEQFAKALQEETGIQVHIIDQDLEGKLTFQAALSKMDIEAEHLVVWDVGGGSIQFVSSSTDGSLCVDCGKEGCGAFADFIVGNIQKRDPKIAQTPNPMSSEDIVQARAHAHQLAQKVGSVFKEKIQDPRTTVVGAGSVFGYGISTLVGKKNPFSVEDLTTIVRNLAGKTDADLGGGDYAFCEGSNAILVLGFMQALKVRKMNIINVNNADGALTYPDLWESSRS